MYDLAVCGAGAVGSYLATLFSQKYKVALIEDGEKIGLPIACSGLYSKRLLKFVDLDSELIENEIKGAHIHIGGKTYDFHRGKTEAYVLHRDRLDSRLAQMASDNGTDILTSHRLTDFESNSHVKVKLQNKGQSKEIEAKMLAGCDGPRSIVRRKSGIEDPKKTLHGIFCYADEKDSSENVDLWFGDIAPGFFAWRIPRGDTVEYGIATEKNAKEKFNIFMKEQNFKPKQMLAGLIPIGPPKSIISENIFLCGDSAAMTKPYTGGGVIYGFTSANVAYDTIDPDEPTTLQEYQKAWHSKLRREIRIGMLMKSAYSWPPFIQRMLLGFLEKKQKKLDMDMPSTIFQ